MFASPCLTDSSDICRFLASEPEKRTKIYIHLENRSHRFKAAFGTALETHAEVTLPTEMREMLEVSLEKGTTFD